ncbi:IS3 family transposase [Gracilibacillus salitolerans]|uniref:IS3 family transposase n=1 Tax=Gracilibacillus salitolerans TaxID=2663022 RepID=A0A5Q2TJD2_9BACI|nr:IS3 family transposase [Gracilibacillus salitolerans]QGH34241.1 IS3 family transposase [Gracilibacillus salitolerans]
MGKKVVYPEEIKREVIRLKLSGELTNKEIMEKFGIKNKTQINTWMRWYRNGEEHRLAQPIGKQYAFGKGPDDDSEISQLRKKVKYYEMRDELFGKVPRNRKEVVPEVFVEVVEAYKEQYTITTICECFEIPKSTYYRWKKRVSAELPLLHQLVIDICQSLSFRVGHRNVRGILQNDHKIKVNRKTVQKIMQKYNLQCQVKVKRRVYIAGESKFVVPNLLKQDFKADRPNQKWVTDITYLPYGEKMLYLSTIMDLYNNEIIAYKVSDTQEVKLVLDTLEAACKGRETYEVILHSDQGAQYTSYDFQELAKEKGITTSMSRKGNCFDNAVIESFHSSLKSEEFNTQNRVHLTNSIVLEKVESYMYYYNYIRPFTKLNCHSPVEFRTMVA